jgi:hypothetical protein
MRCLYDDLCFIDSRRISMHMRFHGKAHMYILTASCIWIYVLLLRYAYMLVFSPIGEGILVYECN